jgi:uncharacterized protein (DUF924 family)
MLSPEEVLDFWFPTGHDQSLERHREQVLWWFRGGADQAICKRFLATLEAAIRGELDAWAGTPRGRLALIIVLDQFSRSAFRDSPKTYAQDEKARQLALDGIEQGDLKGMAVFERLFFALPLAHSEDLELQEQNVALSEENVRLAPAELRRVYEFGLSQARGHRDAIRRFGRHPHRNRILGRESTKEELAHLASEVPVHRRTMEL